MLLVGFLHQIKHVRKSKYDPLIEKVELIEAQHSHIRYPNRKETTVSVQHLAPKDDDHKELNPEQNDMHEQDITEIFLHTLIYMRTVVKQLMLMMII